MFLIVFGVELEFLLRREAGGGPIPPGTVPNVIDQCLGEVESRGLTEVGICTWSISSCRVICQLTWSQIALLVLSLKSMRSKTRIIAVRLAAEKVGSTTANIEDR